MHAQVSIASTDEVDSRDRLAYWEDYNARQLVGLRCSTYHDDGLRAREMNIDLGALRLADIVGNSHVVDRSSQHVAQTPKRSVFVTHLLSGQAFFVHADGCLRLGPGDTLVYDASRPYLFGFETEMHQVMLDLPHDALGGHTGPDALPERGAVVVAGAGSRTLAALMRATVVTSARGDSLSRSAASERLLAAAVAVIRPDDAPQEALRNVARNEIRRRLRDPSLSAETVARAVGVSSRHLNRLFATDGTTITRLIQAERLEAARRDVVDPTCSRLRIADIAARWGFSSQAHLTRAFRREFGVAPAEMRAGRAGT